MSKKRLTKWAITATIIVVGLGAAGWFVWHLRQPIIPADIRSQLSFSPLAYVGGGVSSYKYDSKEKVLSYIIEGEGGNAITVTEQPQPPQFTEIPEYKDRFLENVMKQYSSVQSSNGTVYLTRPPKQSKQVAIIIDKGLLIFMSADKDLSDEQWIKLADHLELEVL